MTALTLALIVLAILLAWLILLIPLQWITSRNREWDEVAAREYFRRVMDGDPK